MLNYYNNNPVLNIIKFLQIVVSNSKMMKLKSNKIGIIYDSRMKDHKSKKKHPERPERAEAIIEALKSKQYLQHPHIEYISEIPRIAKDQELLLAHPKKYIEFVDSLWQKTSNKQSLDVGDTYFNKRTAQVSRIAVGGLLQSIDNFDKGRWKNAFAVIRPPGHHSGIYNKLNGFCVYNNVAIAAKYAIQCKKYKKVAIFDWDIHHGDGTQHILQQYPHTLFISTHRYDNGQYYPCSDYADYFNCGKGIAKGFNINIPFNHIDKNYKQYNFQAPGDNQYIYLFQRLIYPVMKEYNPDMIIVSAGFDASRGDPLGGFNITPNGYYYMTRRLQQLADSLTVNKKEISPESSHVPLLMVLQGGYSLKATSQSVCGVVSALLDQQQFPQSLQIPFKQLKWRCFLQKNNHQQADRIIQFMKTYWQVLQTQQMARYTEIVKSNLKRVFGSITEQQSSSSSDEFDGDENQHRPDQQKKICQIKINEDTKQQSSQQTKTQPQLNLNEQSSKIKQLAISAQCFSHSSMKRFRNFSIFNEQIQKWCYENQYKFYQSQFEEKKFAPKYYGKNGTYIILQNLLYLQNEPIIMDIKLSRQSKNPSAQQDKRQNQKKKELKSTSDKYSFRISGYTTPQFKQRGILTSNQDTVRQMLAKVVSLTNKSLFISFLNDFSEVMRKTNRKYFGTSIVLIKGKERSVIRWIDLHEWTNNSSQYDEDLVEGIENLRTFIQGLQLKQ